MNIFCAIDGTDNLDSSVVQPLCMLPEATLQMENGHVKRIATLGFHEHRYFPGTRDSVTGWSSKDIVERAETWIFSKYGTKRDPEKKLFLSGFSRGGAAVTVIAHHLEKMGIPVQEMYLFDAVDRSWAMNDSETAVVPANVIAAFHAMRHPAANSRPNFGNCATQSANKNMMKRPFYTTHGGVGGWPNGPSRVMPGFGSEDYAYIARDGAFFETLNAMKDRAHDLIVHFAPTAEPAS